MYLLVAAGLSVFVNRDAVLTNRINFLKQFETDLRDFANGRPAIAPAHLRMAARYYREFLRYAPKNGLLYANLGFCHYYLKDTARAIENYQKAQQLAPMVSTIPWDLALIYFEQGDLAAAARIWENHLINQRPMKQYLDYLRQELKARQWNDSLLQLKLVEMRFLRDEQETYIKLSESYYFLQQYPQAKSAALRGLQLYPDDRWLNYMAGMADHMLGEYESAAGYFEQVVKRYHTDINAWYYHGLSMRKAGRPPVAQWDFLKVQELRDAGVEPLPMPKPDVRLRLNAELLAIEYRLKLSR